MILSLCHFPQGLKKYGLRTFRVITYIYIYMCNIYMCVYRNNIYIYIYHQENMLNSAGVCMCVWNIWIDVKLVLLHGIWIDVKLLLEQGGSGDVQSSAQRSSLQASQEARTDHPCVPAKLWSPVVQGLLPISSLFFSLLSWLPAKARTGTSFYNNFRTKLHPEEPLSMSLWWLYGFRNLSVQKIRFDSLSSLFINSLLSGLMGLVLHVRCIPHQNSIRLFWASVSLTTLFDMMLWALRGMLL